MKRITLFAALLSLGFIVGCEKPAAKPKVEPAAPAVGDKTEPAATTDNTAPPDKMEQPSDDDDAGGVRGK